MFGLLDYILYQFKIGFAWIFLVWFVLVPKVWFLQPEKVRKLYVFTTGAKAEPDNYGSQFNMVRPDQIWFNNLV